MSQATPSPELTDAQKLLHLRMSINPSSFNPRLHCSELALRLQAGLPLFYAPGHFTSVST